MRSLIRKLVPQDRYSWLPDWAIVNKESDVHPHCKEEKGDLFEAYNTGSTEYEVLNWLHASIRLLKPSSVLETGAHDGLGTVALASACKMNGFGKVHSVELDPSWAKRLQERIDKEGLSDFVQVHCSDSREFLRKTSEKFDFGFFDSLCEIRAEEFAICQSRKIISNIAVFHDTSPTRCETLQGWPDKPIHDKYRIDVLGFAKSNCCTGYYESILSRGLIALFLARNI